MRISAITFDPVSEPETITAVFTAREAGFLAALLGNITTEDRRRICDEGGKLDFEAEHHSTYGALASEVFNRFYDDGVSDYLDAMRRKA